MNNIQIRAYTDKDIIPMMNIWNEVVTDGMAFPQEDCLDADTACEFSPYKAIAALQRTETEIFSVFTYSTRTTSADAVTYATQAMPYRLRAAASI